MSVSDYNSIQGSGEFPLTPESRLRRKLRYFFMNPCQKWKVKRKFPWKLALQLLKVVLVTIQLAMFGFARSSHVNFVEKSNTAFRHLYLKGWTAAYETLPYPPSTGPFAVYTIPEFYQNVDFAMERYNKTQRLAIGTYHFSMINETVDREMVLCKTHYKQGRIWNNQSFIYDSAHVTECLSIEPVEIFDNKTHKFVKHYDVEEFLDRRNESINFDSLITLKLNFSLKTVHLKSLSRVDSPDCYRFDIDILYDNADHNGQMVISLNSEEVPIECHGTVTYRTDESAMLIFSTIFDAVVVIVSIGSLLLCIRSIFNAQKLKMHTIRFFWNHLHRKLSLSDKLEFLNMWYVLIIVNDVLTIIGSSLKISIETKMSHSYEVCGVLLGTGNLLVWFGVLRYLGFFEKYNILILTMKKSAPSVFRFLVCAGVFYFGFTICGWVVLGPYHIKFRTIGTASECLFSLVNGDDMFTTFQGISNKNPSLSIWFFSRIYLYVFIGLFIYMVLNVFIAVIMQSYEVIQFRQLSTASECLFSLINGDDMFNTFAIIGDSDTYAWWYSQIYLYVFISFFIYVVLSVFISVIMDTYETIKHFYEHGFPKTQMHEFIDEVSPDDPYAPTFNSEHPYCRSCLCSCFPCLREPDDEDTEHDVSERRNLLSRS